MKIRQLGDNFASDRDKDIVVFPRHPLSKMVQLLQKNAHLLFFSSPFPHHNDFSQNLKDLFQGTCFGLQAAEADKRAAAEEAEAAETTESNCDPAA